MRTDNWTKEVVEWHSNVNWDILRPQTRIFSSVLDKTIKSLEIKDDEFILDLGCGSGLFSYEILSRYKNVKIFGIDLSQKMLQMAEQRLSKFEKHRWELHDIDANKMDFSNKFDRIVSVDLLCHLDTPEKVFANIFSALKLEGRAVIVTPAKYCLYRLFKYPFMKSKPPTVFFSKNEIKQLLSNAGFTKIHFDYLKFFDFPFIPIEEHIAIAEKS
jgi:SAM-dependent methyltransferase